MLIVLTAFTSVLHIPSPLPEASATTVTGNIYYPITPIRVCDTRAVDSPYVTSNQCDLNGPETLTSNSTLNIQITGQASIPADATAVVANVTVTDTNSDGGYLSLYPSGATLPNTSNLNWNSGQTVSNLVTTAIGSNGSVAAYNQSGSADVIVDVFGYYGAASLNSSFGEYIPTTPSRICDTRPVNYVTTFQNQCDLTNTYSPIGQNSSIAVQVSGFGGIPSFGVSAVSINVTAINPTTPNGGYITAYPEGEKRPLTSNLNFTKRQTLSKRVIIKLSSTGGITIYNYNGSTDIAIDINGWFSDGTTNPSGGTLYNPIAPIRICDTRMWTTGPLPNQCDNYGSRTLHSGETLAIQVAGEHSLPLNITAIAANTSVTDTDADGGYLTTYSSGTLPIVSDLNWQSNDTVTNFNIERLTQGSYYAYNYIGSAAVIVDVFGFYTQTGNNSLPMITNTLPTSGSTKGGNKVDIYGTGFTNASSVTFGSIPATSFVVDSDSEISAVDPAENAGQIYITVSTSTTSSLSVNATFTYKTPWQISQSYFKLDFNSIACPSTTECFIAGGYYSHPPSNILSTTNSGATWTEDTLPFGTSSIRNITCISINECFAIVTTMWSGFSIIALKNSGATWTQSTVPSNLFEIADITCPSAAICFALGQTNSAGLGTILETTDSGSNWTETTVPSGINIINGLTCPSTTECFIWGNSSVNGFPDLFSTTNSGTTWINQSVSAITYAMIGVTCPSITVCFVYGSDVIYSTTNAGTKWVISTIPNGVSNIEDITCPSTTECFAVGLSSYGFATILNTTNYGASWTIQSLSTSSVINGIACSSITVCFAYGNGVIYSTTNSGSTWVKDAISGPISTVDLFENIICPSASECFASARGNIFWTTDYGISWTPSFVANEVDSINNITCPSSTVCYATIGSYSYPQFILYTTDEGSTWTEENIPSINALISNISCPSTTECFAWGETVSNGVTNAIILTTTDSGNTWTLDTTPATINSINGLTCPSTTECFADGSTATNYTFILRTTDSGVAWNINSAPSNIIPVLFQDYALLPNITCASTAVCFIWGYNDTSTSQYGVLLSTTNSGNNWTFDTIPDDVSWVNDITCPSPIECFAAVSSGYILRTINAGNTWTPGIVPVNTTDTSITCVSTSKCFAIGEITTGNFNNPTYSSVILSTTDSGTSWSQELIPSNTNIAYPIVCPSSTKCFAYGSLNDLLLGGVILSS